MMTVLTKLATDTASWRFGVKTAVSTTASADGTQAGATGHRSAAFTTVWAGQLAAGGVLAAFRRAGR